VDVTLERKGEGCRKRKIVEKCDLTIFPLEFCAVTIIRSDLTVQQIQVKAKKLRQQ